MGRRVGDRSEVLRKSEWLLLGRLSDRGSSYGGVLDNEKCREYVSRGQTVRNT